jgi:predicted DNA-binding transcriptional regulator YafY
MPDAAAASLRRILHLIPELADGESRDVAAVARRAGVDRKTLLRDLHEMADRWDDPAGFVEGVQIFIDADQVSLRSSHFLRPMRITVAELSALELGLALLRTERPPEEHAALERARERLRAAMAWLPGVTRDEQRLAAGPSLPDGHALGSIRTALKRGTKLRLTYRGSRDADAATRTVCPYSVAFASGAWYLVAHCERSSALRVFRVDRIEASEPTDEQYDVPDDFDVEEVMRDGKVLLGRPDERVRIRYSPVVARWVAEREGRAVDADGSLTLDHPLADARWAVRHVLQYGPEAEVLEPESVRQAVLEVLSRL